MINRIEKISYESKLMLGFFNFKFMHDLAVDNMFV